jgi:hypothetical protein
MVTFASPVQQILVVTARHLSIQPRQTPQPALFSSEFKDLIRWRDRSNPVDHRRSSPNSHTSIVGSCT